MGLRKFANVTRYCTDGDLVGKRQYIPRSVPQLERFLQSSQAKQRLYAVTALRLTTSPDAVDTLIGALRDKDDRVRERAASSWIAMTGHSVVEPNQRLPSALQLEDL